MMKIHVFLNIQIVSIKMVKVLPIVYRKTTRNKIVEIG